MIFEIFFYLDVQKKVFLSANRSLHSVRIDLKNQLARYVNIRPQLKRPNHPSNCYTLDLTKHKEIDTENLDQIIFYFPLKNATSITMLIEDKARSLTRSYRHNFLSRPGSTIELKSLKRGSVKDVMLMMEQEMFEEEDEDNPCKNYPNEDYESFEDCDNTFVHDFLEYKFPVQFMPIWATDNTSQVTLLEALKTNGLELLDYKKIISGRTPNNCLRPCLVTSIKTINLGVTSNKRNMSRILIDFPNEVPLTKFEFPKFSLVPFLSEVGGSMGLWLGLGVVQLFQALYDLIQNLLAKLK